MPAASPATAAPVPAIVAGMTSGPAAAMSTEFPWRSRTRSLHRPYRPRPGRATWRRDRGLEVRPRSRRAECRRRLENPARGPRRNTGVRTCPFHCSPGSPRSRTTREGRTDSACCTCSGRYHPARKPCSPDTRSRSNRRRRSDCSSRSRCRSRSPRRRARCPASNRSSSCRCSSCCCCCCRSSRWRPRGSACRPDSPCRRRTLRGTCWRRTCTRRRVQLQAERHSWSGRRRTPARAPRRSFREPRRSHPTCSSERRRDPRGRPRAVRSARRRRGGGDARAHDEAIGSGASVELNVRWRFHCG